MSSVSTNPSTIDGRFALTPGATDFAILFNDGYGSTGGGPYTQPGYVNSIQVHDVQLSDGYIATLSGPSAGGIPTNVQVKPFVASVSPTPGQQSAPPEIAFNAAIHDSVLKVATNSIRLSLNGNSVTPSITASNGQTTVVYSAPGLFSANSVNSYTLVFGDDNKPVGNSYTNDIQFAVAGYTDIQLPLPIVFENFDSTPEGSLPAGWTQTNYTDVSGSDPTVDFGNLDSGAFATWTVVDSSRFAGTFVTYSDPTAVTDDYQRVLSINPSNVVNGQFVKQLATRNMVFADSGYRNGRSQVMYLFTPDFDLTGKSNIYLSFHSLWEQNQDSIAAVEYSVNQGQTWLPVVYMLDGPDVLVDANTNIDAVATFTTEGANADEAIAFYTDPADGQDKGGTYGAFIGVDQSQWSTLGPFISARVDNDPIESKRVELFRLPQADNQSKVRFRFAHAGTDSWYFGIDDFGLYSIATSAAAPSLSVSLSQTGVTISWPTGVSGYTLEGTDNLTNPAWAAVGGVVNNSVTVPAGSGNNFYRLKK